MIFAIDPGTTESGFVLFDAKWVRESGTLPNAEILRRIQGEWDTDTVLAIEMVAHYGKGMPVGKEVFETVVWIGRFQQAWFDPDSVRRVYRGEVKQCLCNSARAKDPNIRQALLDLIGPQGTKAKPGPLYGVKGHEWSALGVAVVVAAETQRSSPDEPAKSPINQLHDLLPF